MGPVIAVAGKGGSGKTTLSGLLVRALLARRIRPVLAVDADPNSNLGEALGVQPGATLGGMVERFQSERDGLPAGMTREALVEMKFNSTLEERTGFDVLTMGRGEGPGCYCSVNNLLRALMEKLAGGYGAVVIDNEAGLEHLSRRTTRKMDLLLVVSDHSVRGLRAAQRIVALVDEIGLEVRKRALVIARAPEPAEPQALLAAAGGVPLELSGVIPYDPAVSRADLVRGSLLGLPADAPSVRAVDALFERVLPQLGPAVETPPVPG